ncbi:MAG: rRNA maturation RNase YbeY [Pseudanabaenaceae cyanobacterium bins.68]|nr:rRNA maturation RNase YbeY [Pseudanabaenaceae cyanobacterium bins.68]
MPNYSELTCPVIEIYLTNLDQAPQLPWQRWFEIWAAQLTGDLVAIASQASHQNSYELSLKLTDDQEMQQLNRQFRGLDRTTDVLAFAALETDLPELYLTEPEPIYLGDIIISVPQAIAQAKDMGHSEKYELAWLAAHGFLHLLGWDHPDQPSLEAMLEQQRVLIDHLEFDFN